MVKRSLKASRTTKLSSRDIVFPRPSSRRPHQHSKHLSKAGICSYERVTLLSIVSADNWVQAIIHLFRPLTFPNRQQVLDVDSPNI